MDLQLMFEQGKAIQDVIEVYKETGNTSLGNVIATLVEGFESQFDYVFEYNYYTSGLSFDDLVADYEEAVEEHNDFLGEAIDYGYMESMEREF